MKRLMWAILILGLSFTATYGIQNYLDKTVEVKEKYYTYTCNRALCDVYFMSSIGAEDNYISLYKLLESAAPGQHINLHLSGNGGYMSAVYHLANAIELSKAEITTIVEGPVYSAHAFISMFGRHVKIANNALFMFHLPAVKVGEDNILPEASCIVLSGHFDRGIDAVQKCVQSEHAEQAMFDRLFYTYVSKYLTSQEIKGLYAGENIIVPGHDMDLRIHK